MKFKLFFADFPLSSGQQQEWKKKKKKLVKELRRDMLSC